MVYGGRKCAIEKIVQRNITMNDNRKNMMSVVTSAATLFWESVKMKLTLSKLRLPNL